MTTSNEINSTVNLQNKSSARNILLNGPFSAVALSHFGVDLLNGIRPTLLTFLSGPLGLNNAALAAVGTAYVWFSAASQPLFGWLADRVGNRWLISGGVLWMFSFFSLAMFFKGPWAIVLLIVASLGSASFHPAGASEASLIGRELYAGRETSAAALFFFFGQLALFLGPVLSGPLLVAYAEYGMLILASILLPIGIYAGWQLRQPTPQPALIAEQGYPKTKNAKIVLIVLLACVGIAQSWAQQNMITFIPKYLKDMGQTAIFYGLISGLFMGGSAIGNVLGGNLADKFGKKQIVMVALSAASIPIYIISLIGWSPWLYLLVPLAGACTGAVHSIIVVLAQRNLPMKMGVASGITLGFIFSAGALGTLLSGPLADAWGWPPVFQITAGLTLLGAVLAVFIKE